MPGDVLTPTNAEPLPITLRVMYISIQSRARFTGQTSGIRARACRGTLDRLRDPIAPNEG